MVVGKKTPKTRTRIIIFFMNPYPLNAKPFDGRLTTKNKILAQRPAAPRGES
jgi:hypothetical protein